MYRAFLSCPLSLLFFSFFIPYGFCEPTMAWAIIAFHKYPGFTEPNKILLLLLCFHRFCVQAKMCHVYSYIPQILQHFKMGTFDLAAFLYSCGARHKGLDCCASCGDGQLRQFLWWMQVLLQAVNTAWVWKTDTETCWLLYVLQTSSIQKKDNKMGELKGIAFFLSRAKWHLQPSVYILKVKILKQETCLVQVLLMEHWMHLGEICPHVCLCIKIDKNKKKSAS